jgi:hypothetical protein
LEVNRRFGETSPLSSGSNNKQSKKPGEAGGKQNSLLLDSRWFLVGLLFDPQNKGETFLRNFGLLSTDYMTLYPRIYSSLLIIDF